MEPKGKNYKKNKNRRKKEKRQKRDRRKDQVIKQGLTLASKTSNI